MIENTERWYVCSGFDWSSVGNRFWSPVPVSSRQNIQVEQLQAFVYWIKINELNLFSLISTVERVSPIPVIRSRTVKRSSSANIFSQFIDWHNQDEDVTVVLNFDQKNECKDSSLSTPIRRTENVNITVNWNFYYQTTGNLKQIENIDVLFSS